MKIAWLILLISAFTDMVITTGTALSTAMVAMGTAEVPSKAVIIMSLIGGIVSAARTVQQALKVTPAQSAALRGNETAGG